MTGAGPAAPGAAGRLRGRVAVITGAAGGIGLPVSRALAGDGMAVLLLGRTGAPLRALAEQLRREFDVPALAAAVAVTDRVALDRVLAQTEQQLGPIDLLVNAAGQAESTEQPFWEADVEQVWAVLETNLRGPMLTCRAVLPSMVARGHGHVVNLASAAQAAGRTGAYTGYAVSKRALTVFTEGLAAPLAGTGVVVLGVLPGLVRTPMTAAMAVWREAPATDYTPVEATTELIRQVAQGRYDQHAGALLDARALAGGPPS